MRPAYPTNAEWIDHRSQQPRRHRPDYCIRRRGV